MASSRSRSRQKEKAFDRHGRTRPARPGFGFSRVPCFWRLAVHAGSFRVMSFRQWGQAIFSPRACAGNSMCPRQKKQDIFNLSSVRRKVMAVAQCGQETVCPRLPTWKAMCPPQWAQIAFEQTASGRARKSQIKSAALAGGINRCQDGGSFREDGRGQSGPRPTRTTRPP